MEQDLLDVSAECQFMYIIHVSEFQCISFDDSSMTSVSNIFPPFSFLQQCCSLQTI